MHIAAIIVDIKIKKAGQVSQGGSTIQPLEIGCY